MDSGEDVVLGDGGEGDTNKVCHLCRGSGSTTRNPSPTIRARETTMWATGLKLLLRYLNVHQEQISAVAAKDLSSSDFGHFGVNYNRGAAADDDDDDGDVEEELLLLEVLADSLCGRCSEIVGSFWEDYQEFEKARLRVDARVEMLRNQIKFVDEGKGSSFKLELINQCRRKLRALPRVVLEKLGGGVTSGADEGAAAGRKGLLLSGPKKRKPDSSTTDNENESDVNSDSDRDSPKKKRKRRIVGKDDSKCLYCNYMSNHSSHKKKHMLCRHPLQFYADQIKKAEEAAASAFVTEKGIDSAILQMFEENIVVETSKRGVFKCQLCVGPQNSSSRKHHVLSCHFDNILCRIKSKTTAETSSADDDADSCNSDSDLKLVAPPPKLGVKSKTNRTVYQTSRFLGNPECQTKWEEHNGVELGKKCYYCGHMSEKVNRNRSHMMNTHTYQYFSSQLPPETTENGLEEALESFFAEGLVTGTESRYRVDCTLCGGFETARSKRVHLVSKHLPEVLSKLRGTRDTDSDPPKNNGSHEGEGGVIASPPETVRKSVSSQPLSLKCQICSKILKSRRSYQLHVETHKSNTEDDDARCVIKCDHCQHVSITQSENRRHMIASHSLAYFTDHLPEGTSQQALETAIQTTILKGGMKKSSTTGTRNGIHCSLCMNKEGRIVVSSMRTHALSSHLQEVISNLKSKSRIIKIHVVESDARTGSDKDEIRINTRPTPPTINPKQEPTTTSFTEWEEATTSAKAQSDTEEQEKVEESIVIIPNANPEEIPK